MAVAPAFESEESHISPESSSKQILSGSEASGDDGFDAKALLGALSQESSGPIYKVDTSKPAEDNDMSDEDEELLKFKPPNRSKVCRAASKSPSRCALLMVERFQAEQHYQHSLYNMGRSRFLPTGPSQLASMGVGIGLYFRMTVCCCGVGFACMKHSPV